MRNPAAFIIEDCQLIPWNLLGTAQIPGGGELRLSGLPAQMRAILAVSDLDTLFPDA